MKRALIVILALTCCVTLRAADVTLDQAYRAVDRWMTLSGVSPSNRVRDGKTYESGRGRFHAVRLAKGGFVITSADTRIRPILAESDHGEFSGDPQSPLYSILMMDTETALDAPDVSKKPAANGVVMQDAARSNALTTERMWAELLDEPAVWNIQQGTASVRKLNAVTVKTGTSAKLHDFILADKILKTEWNQSTHNNYHEENWVYPFGTGKLCYNYYTPYVTDTWGTHVGANGSWKDLYTGDEDSNYVHTRRAACGCVATAGGQVMFKFEYPKTFAFGKMKRKPKNCGGDDCYKAIGDLMRKIGDACGADWAKDAREGTGMKLNRLMREFRNSFSYKGAAYVDLSNSGGTVDASGISDFDRLVVPNLTFGKPVLLSITKTEGQTGHCVVADGVKLKGGRFSYHINMGWGGSDDAWCTMPNIEKYKIINGIGVNIDPSERKGLLTVLVVDDNGSPVRGASVSLDGTVSGTTDVRGVCSFSGSGEFTVRAEKGGLVTGERSVTLSYGDESGLSNAFIVFTLAEPIQLETPSLVISHPAKSATAIIAPGTSLSEYDAKYGAGKVSVRVTFDGSLPTEMSPSIKGAFTHSGSGNVVVKARAFCDGYKSSNVFEETIEFPIVKNNGTIAEICEADTDEGEVVFDNSMASTEIGEPSHSPVGKVGGASMWMKFTPSASGDYTFRLAGETSDEMALDTQLAVYRVRSPLKLNDLGNENASGELMSSLVPYVANDDVGAFERDYSSRVSFAATQGESYYIAVDTANGERGRISLSWQPGRNDTVEPAEHTIYCNAGAERHSVVIHSTGSWSAHSAPDWVTVTKGSGADGDILEFEVQALSEGGTRTATILLTSGEEGENSAVAIAQSDNTWVMSRASAVEVAKRQGKRILMVCGRDICPNTTYLRQSACENADVKPVLAAEYVLWYCNCDEDYEEYAGYDEGLDSYTLPLVCILDPSDMSKYVARSTGFLSVSDFKAFLDDNAEPDVPSVPAGLTASGGIGSGAVSLIWGAARRATSYEVWRGRSWDPAEAVCLADSLVEESFEDQTAVAGVLYWYRVRAVNASGKGSFSVPAGGCWKSSSDGGDARIGEALGAPQLIWRNDAEYPWTIQDSDVWDGTSALKSAVIDDKSDQQKSIVRTSVAGPTRMSFRFKGTMYYYGRFSVLIDGVSAYEAGDDDFGWTLGVVDIPSGSHEVSLVLEQAYPYYSTSYPTCLFLDAVWFDVASKEPTFVLPTTDQETTATKFTGRLSVGLSAPDGGTVYYTTDGDTPTSESQVYEGPIEITESTRIKAICVQPGHCESVVMSGLYIERHPVVPGEWTTDVSGAKNAALKSGNLIVTLCANCGTCSYSRSFRAVATDPSFLSWAKANGVYLISADSSLHVDASTANSRFWNLFYDAGQSGYVYYPSLAITSAWEPDRTIGYAVARSGNTIGGVTYANTVESLEKGLEACFSTRPTGRSVSVTFDSNCYPYKTEVRSLRSGQSYGTLPVPTRANYIFDGWWTSQYAGSGERVSADCTVPYSDLTLYAHWTTPATYAVTYSAGSYGIGSTPSSTKTQGMTLTLKDSVFSRPGYTQTGWSRSSGGNTKDFNLRESYTEDAAVTLYPYWTVNSYCVVYNLGVGGAHGSAHPTSVTYDTAFQVSAPTRNGYTFAGWTVTGGLNASTAKWGTGPSPTMVISSSSMKCVNGAMGGVWFKNLTATANGSVTLTANWTRETYHYDGNGATSGSMSDFIADGSDAPLNRFVRPGYVFLGWSLDPDATEPIWGDGDVLCAWMYEPDKASHVLYAVWKPLPYGVRFIRNDGAGMMTTAEMPYGVSTKLPTLKALGWERRGFAFTGWYTSAANITAGKVWKQDGATVSAPTAAGTTMEVYAGWQLKAGYYQIKFNKNDGSGKWRSLGYERGVSTTLPTCANGLGWTRKDYMFAGWATSAANAAEGKVWKTDAAAVKDAIAEGKTLNVYAVWVKAYSIRFIRNDGAGTIETVELPYGVSAKLPTLKALGWARRGYVFTGWYVSTANIAVGKVWKPDGGTVASPTAAGTTMEVYAGWQLKDGYYQIKFNKNDGSGKWRSLGYECGVSTALPTCANGLGWTYRGYAFAGWATSAANAADGKVWKTDAAAVKDAIAEGKTLNVYAIWKKASANAMSMNGVVAPSLVPHPPSLIPGCCSGLFADGSGTFDLLVEKDGSAFFRAETEDGVWTEECEAEAVGETLVLTFEDATPLVIQLESGAWVAESGFPTPWSDEGGFANACGSKAPFVIWKFSKVYQPLQTSSAGFDIIQNRVSSRKVRMW